jgi:hypothetical protein
LGRLFGVKPVEFEFTWQAIAESGEVESVCEQTIYGESLAEACAYFESFHGSLGKDENGASIEITSIKESK